MKENINLFSRILERFKFRVSLPEEVRRMTYSFMRDSVKDVLRHFGQYTLLNRLTVNVFYAARALKLRPSMSLSRAIVGVSAALFTAAIVFVTYMLFADTEKQT